MKAMTHKWRTNNLLRQVKFVLPIFQEFKNKDAVFYILDLLQNKKK